MLRVYALFVIRKLKNPLVFESVLLVTSFIVITLRVSIRHVIGNTPHDTLASFYHFWVTAFLNTQFIVQLTTLVIGVMAILLIKDTLTQLKIHPRTFL